jgi:hypothetical protein
MLEKRKPTDLVKPRVSEATAYDLQKYSAANRVADLEDKVAGLTQTEADADKNGEEFDREAFSKLKEELR